MPENGSRLDSLLVRVNAAAPPRGQVAHRGSFPFGPRLNVDRFELDNGLSILVCEDHAAPVIAYHTWFRVGSRHERPGKTGLAHLFEHLMFNEAEHLAPGEFDRRLEEAGAETNAATWLDFTQFNVTIPADRLDLVVQLEAERMAHLVLQQPQVASEKEVVANERRYRVEDDVEGAVSEQLWATAFERHSYRWPTIGWMEDIRGFTTDDCREFYETYYAPNNATLVLVGDVSTEEVLRLVSAAYGAMERAVLPVEDVHPEPPQSAERGFEAIKPTATEKILVGYRSPALGDFDHPALALLMDVLLGGRASRVHEKLVRTLEIATEVRAFVGPFRDPGLVEVFASARGKHTAEELMAAIDEEVDRVLDEPVKPEEIERARARTELSLLCGLETVDGRASTLGFYETLLGRPSEAFDRLEAMKRIDAGDLRRVARRYLGRSSRTVARIRPQTTGALAESEA